VAGPSGSSPNLRRAGDEGAVASGTDRPEPVVVVLEGKAREGVQEPASPTASPSCTPSASGDDTLVDIAGRCSDEEVTLVTADRELRRRAEALGADVVGPTMALRALIPEQHALPRPHFSRGRQQG
jgi:hypothetical protein